MGEELLPGLVQVIEERLGRAGKPFTTLIIVSAGLGIIAWGCSAIYSNAIAPLVEFLGLGVDAELAKALIGLAVVLGILGLMVLLFTYAVRQISGRGLRDRIRQLEAKIEEMEAVGRD